MPRELFYNPTSHFSASITFQHGFAINVLIHRFTPFPIAHLVSYLSSLYEQGFNIPSRNEVNYKTHAFLCLVLGSL